MLPPTDAPLLAHPLAEHPDFPLAPWAVAVTAALVVIAVATAWPERRSEAAAAPPPTSWSGKLSQAQIVTRSLAVGLLLVAILAGRTGAEEELDNLAPALVVGVAWPLLVLACALFASLWRWVDPWDGIARVLADDGELERDPHVWLAVVPALGWVWYLSAYSTPLDPRSVGLALAIYSIVTIAGCLVWGRQRWLSTGEPFGIVLSWIARVPRRALGSWEPPSGAALLVGVLAGGVLFGAARRSTLWGELNAVPNALGWATLGVLGSALLVATILWLAARGGDDPVPVRAAIPSLVAIVVAVALDRSRLLTSLQLLPRLLFDPLGRGWDPLRLDDDWLVVRPLEDTTLLYVQIAVLMLGHVAAAIVIGRALPPERRWRPIASLATLVALAVVALTVH
jgi:hypothetical protein